MTDRFLNSRLPETDNLNQTALPSQQQWSRLESNRLLLEPRKQITSTIFRLLAVAAILPHAPLALVAVWAVLIFGAGRYMGQLIDAYSAQLKQHPNAISMSPGMTNIVRRYKQAWLINCVIWGLLSFLSQFWLPDVPRLVCIVILNALMFLSITRTYIDRSLMHWVSAVLVISQLIFVVLRFVSVGHFVSARPDDTERLLAFVFYLLLVLYLLWIVGNRFNQMHVQRLGFEYSKLQLIETLSQSQDQLHIERQALVAANKLVQQFYSGAAHDLRQPVYAMQLYTTMLADDPTQSKVLLPKITQSCAAINDMFNTLFDYQQTHMNDTELVEKDINIQEAFQSLALHFQPIASNKGLQIRFKPIPGSITIVPLYFVRILSNLIANALRYTNTGGVLIAARKTRTHIRFQVWDTGIGMDDATVRNIFDEFYKANSSETVNDGLGLGLSIAKQLSSRIEHANISVKSRAARGSVFKFSIPIARYKLEML